MAGALCEASGRADMQVLPLKNRLFPQGGFTAEGEYSEGETAMKKKIFVLLLLTACLLAAAAFGEEYPVYGRCIGEKVNVRVKPDSNYPSYGRIIHDAPLQILGEEGDTYYCSTAKGKGYIPKMYVEKFEGMTYLEFKEYSRDNPSEYRKIRPRKNQNRRLLLKYYAGKISEEQLLDGWTGKGVFVRDSDGRLYQQKKK